MGLARIVAKIYQRQFIALPLSLRRYADKSFSEISVSELSFLYETRHHLREHHVARQRSGRSVRLRLAAGARSGKLVAPPVADIHRAESVRARPFRPHAR